MARNREIAVILLDVSPSMHPYLKLVVRAASTLIQRKLIVREKDEVGLVIFGVNEPSNDLYEELGGYEHVSVLRHIRVVDDDILKILEDLPEGSEYGDYVDALVVSMDMLINHARPGKKANKHIFLITDGESFVKDSAEDESKEEQMSKLAEQLNAHGIKLDTVVLSTRRASYKSKARLENEALLKQFSECPQVEVSFVDSSTSLLGAIKPQHKSPVTLYRGDLELTPNMTLKVWVYKKVARERLPTLKKYSDKAPRGAPHVSHLVKMDIEYKSVEDPDKVVPPEQRTKAYRYGPQLIPISSVVEDALKLKTQKGLKLIGFTDASKVLRHYYMKESYIFIPEPGNEKSILAMSALARAMNKLNKVAIMRCVWRRGQASVVIGVLTPYLSIEENFTDCFYFNILPYMDDGREFPFASLDSLPSNMQPSASQQDAADKLVKLFDLAPQDKEEKLLPERTLNPVLQRWYQFLHQKHMDSSADVPRLDDAFGSIVEPDQDLITEVESAIKAFNSRFTLKVNEEKGKQTGGFWKDKDKMDDVRGEDDIAMDDVGQISFDSLTARKVLEVGSLEPVQDFESMLAHRDSDEWAPKAIREMKKLIVDFLDSAYKGNTFEKSMACLSALRKGCVEQGEPEEFNKFLRKLASKCRGRRLNDFWDLLIDRQLTLISKEEARDSDVSEEQALAFISRNQARDITKEPAPEEEIDELEALLGEVV